MYENCDVKYDSQHRKNHLLTFSWHKHDPLQKRVYKRIPVQAKLHLTFACSFQVCDAASTFQFFGNVNAGLK